MKQHIKLLNQAIDIARQKNDRRSFRLGAIGFRNDGATVTACNGFPHGGSHSPSHCEARLLRKLGLYGTIFLARVTANGQWANASPCLQCRLAIKAAKVKKVFYTSGPEEYVVWIPGLAKE